LKSRVKEIAALPALPAILMPLMQCLQLPAQSVDIHRVVRLVSWDESIAAQFIKMANYAAFGRRRQVETVRDAVVTLGIWRVSDIVFSCAIPSITSFLPGSVDPRVFWRHALGSAMITQ